MAVVDRILLIIASTLSLLLIVGLIVFLYYVIRYKNTNIFTDKGQRSVEEIKDDEILKILDNLTVRMASMKDKYFREAIKKWNKEVVVVYYCNLLRLVMEKGQIDDYFRQGSEEFILKTSEELAEIGLCDLGEMIKTTKNECLTEIMSKEALTTKYMWYKLPLKNALLAYIRTNIEKY